MALPVAQITYRHGACDMWLFCREPTTEEVAAVHSGTCEFALFDRDELCVICHRFTDGDSVIIPWTPAPYQPSQPFEAPTAPGDSMATLQIIMFDSGGQVRAMRSTSLSPEVTRDLYAAIGRQEAGPPGRVSGPWDPGLYDSVLAALYRTYPTGDLLAAACRVRCEGLG